MYFSSLNNSTNHYSCLSAQERQSRFFNADSHDGEWQVVCADISDENLNPLLATILPQRGGILKLPI